MVETEIIVAVEEGNNLVSLIKGQPLPEEERIDYRNICIVLGFLYVLFFFFFKISKEIHEFRRRWDSYMKSY